MKFVCHNKIFQIPAITCLWETKISVCSFNNVVNSLYLEEQSRATYTFFEFIIFSVFPGSFKVVVAFCNNSIIIQATPEFVQAPTKNILGSC